MITVQQFIDAIREPGLEIKIQKSFSDGQGGYCATGKAIHILFGLNAPKSVLSRADNIEAVCHDKYIRNINEHCLISETIRLNDDSSISYESIADKLQEDFKDHLNDIIWMD